MAEKQTLLACLEAFAALDPNGDLMTIPGGAPAVFQTEAEAEYFSPNSKVVPVLLSVIEGDR